MSAKELWKAVQRHLRLTPDGVPGAATAAAVSKALGVGAAEPEDEVRADAGDGAAFSARTERVLGSLLPQVQGAFRKLMAAAVKVAARHGLTAEAISGLRTYAEQDELYAQGRTKPGKVVTNARAGYSNHNFGTAADLGLFRGRSYVDAAEPGLAERVYREIAAEAKGLGIEWGGDWKSIKDTPHFEFRTGLTTAQMRARVAAGKPVV